MRLKLALFSCACVLFWQTVPAAVHGSPPPRFRLVPLASFAGSTRGFALNDKGQSAGESGSGTLSNSPHAFLGQPDGGIAPLEIPGFDVSVARAVNNVGQVAGTLGSKGDPHEVLFRYSPGLGTVVLGTMGGDFVSVIDMNDRGDIIGQARDANSVTHAYVYTDATGFVSLNEALDSSLVSVADINNAGDVVGYFETPQHVFHAFLWDGVQAADLGTLGGDSSFAVRINDAGEVVGAAALPASQRAFRYSRRTGMQVVPDGPGVPAVNANVLTEGGLLAGTYFAGNVGYVFYNTPQDGTVGLAAELGPGITHAIAADDAGRILLLKVDNVTFEFAALLYAPGSGVHNLNDLVVGELNWWINEPVAMNVSGQILVNGYTETSYSCGLLVPLTPGDLDADGDGAVGQADLGLLLAAYGG